jgi:serine protease
MSEHNLHLNEPIPYLPAPIVYTPENFNSNLKGDGEGVKICIVDCGFPDHFSILNIGGNINFTDSEDGGDVLGHATIVSGFLAADDAEQITGLAPKATYYYAKMIDDEGNVGFGAFVAAILWGIIKEVDLIVVSMTSDVYNSSLEETIKKATDSNICVVATSKSHTVFPATFPNVLAVGDGGWNEISDGPFYSTFVEQNYAQGRGPTVATAIASGLAALVIGQAKKEGKKLKPQEVYEAVKASIKKDDDVLVG